MKLAIKPHYNKGRINKDEYKDIMRRAVPKVGRAVLFYTPSRHSLVGRSFVCDMIGPGFEPHQCLLTGTWKR